MKATFKHKLKNDFRPGELKKEVSKGEELEFCNDIEFACRMMETKGWTNKIPAATINRDGNTLLYYPVKDVNQWSPYVERQNDISKELSQFASEVLLDLPSKPSIERVGGSQLDITRGFLARPWRTANGAMNFVQGWNRVWDALLEFRITSIHTFCSATFTIQGEYVSVVVLPPVYINDAADIALPDGSGSFTSYMAELLAAVLQIGDLKKLKLHRGRDGHYYLLHLRDVLTDRFENGINIARKELLNRRLLTGKTNMPIQNYIREVAIPQAITSLVTKLTPLEDNSAQTIVKDSLLRNELRSFGVNMLFLFEVKTQANARTQAAQGPEKQILANIANACVTEMLGRVLKDFVRADIMNFRAEGRKDTAIRIEIVNRIARLTLTKDEAFWTEHINPAIRSKYRCPEQFSVFPKECHLPTVLRVMSTKIGCIFDQEGGRFGSFPDITAAWSRWHEPPAYVMEPPPPEQYPALVEKAWADLQAFKQGSILHQAYLGRALIASVLFDGDKTKAVDTMLERRSAYRDPSAKAYISTILVELNVATKKETLFSAALDDLKEIPLNSESGPNLSASGVGFMYLSMFMVRPRPAPVILEAAASSTAKCPWVDLDYHPFLWNLIQDEGGKLAELNDDEVEHHCNAIEAVAAFTISQGGRKTACGLYQEGCGPMCNTNLKPGVIPRRNLCCTSAETHIEEFGLPDHKTWLAVFQLAFHCGLSSDNPKLVEVLKEIVDKASIQPDGPVERVKQKTNLEFAAKRPATIEALRAVARYGSEKDSTTIHKYILWVEQEMEQKRKAEEAKNANSQPEAASQEPQKEAGKEKPETPPKDEAATPAPKKDEGKGAKSDGDAAPAKTPASSTQAEPKKADEPAEKRQGSTPQASQKPQNEKQPEKEKKPGESTSAPKENSDNQKKRKASDPASPPPPKAAKAKPQEESIAQSEEKKPAEQPPADEKKPAEEKTAETKDSNEAPARRTSTNERQKRNDEQQQQPQQQEEHQKRNSQQEESDPPPLSPPLYRQNTFAKSTTFFPDDLRSNTSFISSKSPNKRTAEERELQRQASLRRSVFHLRGSSSMLEYVGVKKKKLEEHKKRKESKKYEPGTRISPVPKKVLCPAAIFPLDPEPDVPPPPETTPCFEIKFSTSIPKHPCEAEMRKRDAMRRAKAAMELAGKGVGRHGALPTLSSALVENGKSTMLVGPLQNDEHRHVHLSPERRRPRSLPPSTVVLPSPRRAIVRTPQKREAFVFEYTHTTIGRSHLPSGL